MSRLRRKSINKPKHSISEHNWHISRNKRCPLCEQGSEMVHDSFLEGDK